MAKIGRYAHVRRARKHSTIVKGIFFFRSILDNKGKSLRIFQKLLEKLFTDISEHLFAVK